MRTEPVLLHRLNQAVDNSTVFYARHCVNHHSVLAAYGKTTNGTLLIPADVQGFIYAKNLCLGAYGPTPGKNEPTGKKKSVRITCAGVYRNSVLVQVAYATVKYDQSPYYKAKCERIMKSRGKKRTIISIITMILTAAYHILSTGEVWNPTDFYKIDML